MSQGSADDAQVGQDRNDDVQEGDAEAQQEGNAESPEGAESPREGGNANKAKDPAASFVWKDAAVDAPGTSDRTGGGSGAQEQESGNTTEGDDGKKSAAHAAFRCPFNWKQVEDIAVVTTTLRAMDECPHAKGGAGLSDTIYRLYPIVIKEMVTAGEWIPGQFNHPPSEDSIRWRVTKPGNGHTVYHRFMQIKAPVKQHLLPWLKAECGPDGYLPPPPEMFVVLKKIKQKLWEQVATPREKMSLKTVPSNWGFPAWVAFQKWGPHADNGGHPAFCEGFEHLKTQRRKSLENPIAAGSKRKHDGGSNPAPGSTAEVQTPAPASRNTTKLPIMPGIRRAAMPPAASSAPSSVPAGVVVNEMNQHPAFAQQQQLQHAAALMQQMVANQMAGAAAQHQQMPPMPPMSAAQQYQMGGMFQNFAQAQGMQQHPMSAQPAVPSEALSRRQVDLKLALESLDREVSTLVTLREATEDEKERKELLEQLRALRETAMELRRKAVAIVNNSVSASTKTGNSSGGTPIVEVVKDPNDLEMNGKITINITFRQGDTEKRTDHDKGEEGQAEKA